MKLLTTKLCHVCNTDLNQRALNTLCLLSISNVSYVFFQTKLPVLENHLSITVRSLIDTLNSQTPYARKVSLC